VFFAAELFVSIAGQLLLSLTHQGVQPSLDIRASFISSIDGTSSEISTKELCGGARIYYIFNSVFGHSSLVEISDEVPSMDEMNEAANLVIC
jgi:hypothetical protein